MMSEREQLPNLTPRPFGLPTAFLERFGYPYDRRFVGIYWERAGDEVAFDDGVHAAAGAQEPLMPEGVEQKLPPGPLDLRWLRSGRLHGVWIGGPWAGWRISESELERLLETTRKDRPSGHDAG